MHPVNHRRRAWRLTPGWCWAKLWQCILMSRCWRTGFTRPPGLTRFCARAVPAPITPLMKACALTLCVRTPARRLFRLSRPASSPPGWSGNSFLSACYHPFNLPCGGLRANALSVSLSPLRQPWIFSAVNMTPCLVIFCPHISYTKERRDSEVDYGFRLGK